MRSARSSALRGWSTPDAFCCALACTWTSLKITRSGYSILLTGPFQAEGVRDEVGYILTKTLQQKGRSQSYAREYASAHGFRDLCGDQRVSSRCEAIARFQTLLEYERDEGSFLSENDAIKSHERFVRALVRRGKLHNRSSWMRTKSYIVHDTKSHLIHLLRDLSTVQIRRIPDAVSDELLETLVNAFMQKCRASVLHMEAQKLCIQWGKSLTLAFRESPPVQASTDPTLGLAALEQPYVELDEIEASIHLDSHVNLDEYDFDTTDTTLFEDIITAPERAPQMSPNRDTHPSQECGHKRTSRVETREESHGCSTSRWKRSHSKRVAGDDRFGDRINSEIQHMVDGIVCGDTDI